jgi:hypothetical protein
MPIHLADWPKVGLNYQTKAGFSIFFAVRMAPKENLAMIPVGRVMAHSTPLHERTRLLPNY